MEGRRGPGSAYAGSSCSSPLEGRAHRDEKDASVLQGARPTSEMLDGGGKRARRSSRESSVVGDLFGSAGRLVDRLRAWNAVKHHIGAGDDALGHRFGFPNERA